MIQLLFSLNFSVFFKLRVWIATFSFENLVITLMLMFCILFLFVHVLTLRISFFSFFSRIKSTVFYFILITISLCLNVKTDFDKTRNNASLKSVKFEDIDFFNADFFIISIFFVIFLNAWVFELMIEAYKDPVTWDFNGISISWLAIVGLPKD